MDGQDLDEVLTELAKILGEFKSSAVIGGGVAPVASTTLRS